MGLTYGLLGLAIVFEVCGTVSLKASDGFTRPGFTVLVFVGYFASFFLVGQVLHRGLDVSLVYAVWSACGIVAIATIGVVFFGDQVTPLRVIGLVTVVAGVLVLELSARTA